MSWRSSAQSRGSLNTNIASILTSPSGSGRAYSGVLFTLKGEMAGYAARISHGRMTLRKPYSVATWRQLSASPPMTRTVLNSGLEA